MMKDVQAEVTALKLEIARFQEAARLEILGIESRALNIERIAKEQETLRNQMFHGRMDSLPDEEKVCEWAHVATKECLEGKIATAIFSITATSASYAKNELAKAKKEMKEGRGSALKEIEATKEKALTAANEENEKALKALEAKDSSLTKQNVTCVAPENWRYPSFNCC